MRTLLAHALAAHSRMYWPSPCTGRHGLATEFLGTIVADDSGIKAVKHVVHSPI
jgi:hypothetical protein